MGEDAAGQKGMAGGLMRRRAFLAGGVGMGLALPLLGPTSARAALPGIPSSGQVAFKVYRKGAHIGEHDLRFDMDGDNLTVTVHVHIVVKIGPVPVYNYTHRSTEHWRGDRFVNMDSATQSNVSKHKVSAVRMGDGVHVEPATLAPYVAPVGAVPLTHWNRSIYGGPLFNPDDGKPLRITVANKVEDMVKLDDGSSVSATHYTLVGEAVQMEDYYDSSGVWTGLRAKVEDGSFVDYRRV